MGSPIYGTADRMGPSTVWFLLLLSVGLVSVCTRVDGVRTRGIQTFGKVSNSSGRVVNTGAAGSPPGGAHGVMIRSVWRKRASRSAIPEWDRATPQANPQDSPAGSAIPEWDRATPQANSESSPAGPDGWKKGWLGSRWDGRAKGGTVERV